MVDKLDLIVLLKDKDQPSEETVVTETVDLEVDSEEVMEVSEEIEVTQETQETQQ